MSFHTTVLKHRGTFNDDVSSNLSCFSNNSCLGATFELPSNSQSDSRVAPYSSCDIFFLSNTLTNSLLPRDSPVETETDILTEHIENQQTVVVVENVEHVHLFIDYK